ncbi:MAG TPA: Bax inhibitor-1 family protein [Thermoanaerobaculia bacterium]|nr:Bax inhibitor-1 family protein [Thermoanaerobaculia bacterium]
MNPDTYQETLARSSAQVEARSAFIVRTYNHLLSAILGFTLFEVVLFQTGAAETIARSLLGVNWLLVLGGFIVVSWLASRVAASVESVPVQYLALAAFVVAEGIIFVPLLYIANTYAPGTIQSAAALTLVGFAGLTAIAFKTRKDFSFLGGMLRWAFVVALVAIVGGVLFGFELGTWFSVLMVGLAGAAILYDTSNVIRHFPEDRYVAAALQLFASVALMFWYVLRIFVSRD